MLFEIFMARLDILNSQRTSVKKILIHLKSNPQQFLPLIPTFIESIILMATLANIKINGIIGVTNIKVLFILYIFIIFKWENDESSSLEKTMTVLDNYLNQLEKIAKFIK